MTWQLGDKRVERTSDGWLVLKAGEGAILAKFPAGQYEVKPQGQSALLVSCIGSDHRQFEFWVGMLEGLLAIHYQGVSHRFEVQTAEERLRQLLSGQIGSSAAGEVRSKMPGKVVKYFVKPGDPVVKGQSLLILEAMKMENEIKSEYTGRVTSVVCQAGDSVVSKQTLLTIEATE